MAKQNFGTAPDGSAVEQVTISNGALSASILSFGAIIQDLRLAGHDAPLTLGFETLQDYIDHPNYFGAVVGRYANRIREGRFSIDGHAYAVEPERPEANGLHGGSNGYGCRNWTIMEHGDDIAALALVVPAGTMGFPGTLQVRCVYRIVSPATLSMEITATTDAPTLCNLAQHAYFNLDDGGATDILRHDLMIDADSYLPTDDAPLPIGDVRPVEGGEMDFRTSRPIGLDSGTKPFPYDHNYCLARSRGPLRHAVTARGAQSGVEMQLWTGEPGVQFYAGQLIEDDLVGLGGIRYRPYSGFCIESQVWPDSLNQPSFPQAILRPGETYRQETEWRFAKLA